MNARANSVYYLDFAPDPPTLDPVDVYPYSMGEKIAILDGLASMYAPFSYMTFVLDEPVGDYSPVQFNTTAIGTSTGVDFRDVAFVDSASVNALKGLSFVGVGSPTSTEVVKASINLAAHEIGHLEGLRHHDAYTPIGGGMPSSGIASDYFPVYPGPTGAVHTFEDVQSLTTSLGGFTYANLTGDLGIGQRSAIKLAFNGDPAFFSESSLAPHDSFITAAALPVKTIGLPNVTKPSDPIYDKPLIAEVVAILGAIELDGPVAESDYYRFYAKTGDFVQIEVLSEIISSRLDEFNVAVGVYDESDALLDIYYGDSGNADERESTDALVLDLPIDHDGEYIIKVFPQFPDTDPIGDYELYFANFRVLTIPEPTGAAAMLVLLALGLGHPSSRRLRS